MKEQPATLYARIPYHIVGLCIILIFHSQIAAQTPKDPPQTHLDCIHPVPESIEGGTCHSVGWILPAAYCEPKAVMPAYKTCASKDGKAPCEDWSCSNKWDSNAGYTVYMYEQDRMDPVCAAALAAAGVACASGPHPACAAALGNAFLACGTLDACVLKTCEEIPGTEKPLGGYTLCNAGCPDPPPPNSPK